MTEKCSRAVQFYSQIAQSRSAMVLPTAIVTLRCHPQTAAPWIRGITAQVRRTSATTLSIAFHLEGDVDKLHIPPSGPPRRADHLWSHTCFETFIAPAGRSSYYEFNFAPSGQWAAYAFQRYRERAPAAFDLSPTIAMRRFAVRFDLNAIIRLDDLTEVAPHAKLRLGVAAVIENQDGALSYWALRHPPGRPDFHHPDAFALEIGRAIAADGKHPACGEPG